MNAALGATLAGRRRLGDAGALRRGTGARPPGAERVTEPHTFAHQARALEEHPDWASTDLASCTKVFGKSVFTRHPSVIGDPSWNMPIGYGLSETSSFFTGLAMRRTTRRAPQRQLRPPPPRERAPGGRPRDRRGARSRSGGRARSCGARTLMEHYVKRTRAETASTPTASYPTGDVGCFDADGFVHFDGRRTEVIKTGRHQRVARRDRGPAPGFATRGQARPGRGRPRRPPRRDRGPVRRDSRTAPSASEEDITSFLRDRLASYKVPRRVLFFGPTTRSRSTAAAPRSATTRCGRWRTERLNP